MNSKYFGSVKAINRGVPGLSAVFLVGTSGKPRGSKEGSLVWLEPEKVLGKLAYKDNDLA